MILSHFNHVNDATRVPLSFLFFLIFFRCLLGEAPNQFQTTRLSAGRDYSLIKAPTRIQYTHPHPSIRPVSPRLRGLAPETDQARAQGLLSSTTWLNRAFVTETEVAQNQGGAGWLQSRIPGDATGDASQRMLRLGLTGTAGSLRYGMLSRSAGQAFLGGPDQARREVWGEWTSGWTTLRTAIGQQWNNITEDSTRSRLEQTYGQFGLAWKRPVWPEITLTYAHNSLNSTLEPHGLERPVCIELYPRKRSSACRNGVHNSDADAYSGLSPFDHVNHFSNLSVS